jgi:hypothetical protein
MAIPASYLSDAQKAKLAYDEGVDIGNGRILRRGVIVSAEDAYRGGEGREGSDRSKREGKVYNDVTKQVEAAGPAQKSAAPAASVATAPTFTPAPSITKPNAQYTPPATPGSGLPETFQAPVIVPLPGNFTPADKKIDVNTWLGFAGGGYTGPGHKLQPAGVVHAGEFVIPKEKVEKIGVDKLDKMYGTDSSVMKAGYVNGGGVKTDPTQFYTAHQYLKARGYPVASLNTLINTGRGNLLLQEAALMQREEAKGLASRNWAESERRLAKAKADLDAAASAKLGPDAVRALQTLYAQLVKVEDPRLGPQVGKQIGTDAATGDPIMAPDRPAIAGAEDLLTIGARDPLFNAVKTVVEPIKTGLEQATRVARAEWDKQSRQFAAADKALTSLGIAPPKDGVVYEPVNRFKGAMSEDAQQNAAYQAQQARLGIATGGETYQQAVAREQQLNEAYAAAQLPLAAQLSEQALRTGTSPMIRVDGGTAEFGRGGLPLGSTGYQAADGTYKVIGADGKTQVFASEQDAIAKLATVYGPAQPAMAAGQLAQTTETSASSVAPTYEVPMTASGLVVPTPEIAAMMNAFNSGATVSPVEAPKPAPAPFQFDPAAFGAVIAAGESSAAAEIAARKEKALRQLAPAPTFYSPSGEIADLVATRATTIPVLAGASSRYGDYPQA